MDPIFLNLNLLEIVERFAECEGGICSEEELSEYFDREVVPGLIKETLINGHKVSRATIRCAFVGWSENLCRNGFIHEEQRQDYCYVGEYS